MLNVLRDLKHERTRCNLQEYGDWMITTFYRFCLEQHNSLVSHTVAF